MNEVLNVIMARRSVRMYKNRPIDPEHLREILLAGTFAPSAAGRQSPIIVSCQNAKLNDELGQINMEFLRQIMDKRPPMDTKSPDKPAAAPGFATEKKSAFHGAPTVVTLFAPKNWYNFTLDCAVAAQNMMLAATSLGVGSCMIARATETFATERGQEIQASWGIGDEYEAKIHVLLGYSDAPVPSAKPRKEDHLIMIP